MAVFYTEDGTPIWVTPEQQATAWRAGLRLPKADYIVMHGPKGEAPQNVPVGELDIAFQRGWRVEERKEKVVRRYGDKDAQAFLYGAAQGASMGLAQAAMVKLGVAEEETLDGLVEANPIASTAGEITGIVGSAFVPGMAAGKVAQAARAGGTFARAARGVQVGLKATPAYWATRIGASTAQMAEQALLKTATGAAGKEAAAITLSSLGRGAVSMAAGGAVEGGLYGTGHAVSEAALGNIENTREALVQYIGPAALWGGAAGGVLGAGTPLAKAAMAKAGRGVKAGLDWAGEKAVGRVVDTADERIRVALNMSKAQKSGLGKKWELFKQALFDEDMLPDGKIVQRGAEPDEIHARIIQASDMHGPRISAAREGFDRVTREAGIPPPNVDKTIQHLSKRADELAQSPNREYQAWGRELRQKSEDYATYFADPDNRTFARMGETKMELDRLGKSASYTTPRTEAQWGFSKAARELEGEIFEQMDKVARAAPDAEIVPGLRAVDAIAEYRKSIDAYSALRQVATLAEKGKLAARLEKSELPSFLSRMGAGAVSRIFLWGAAPGPAIAGAAAWAGARPAIGKVSNLLRGAPGDDLIRMHAITQGDRASRLGALLEGMESLQRRIDANVKRFLGPEGRAAKTTPLAAAAILTDFSGKEDPYEAAEWTTDYINSLVVDPVRTADNISATMQPIEEVAPELSAASAQLAAEIALTMQDALPKVPVDTMTMQFNLQRRVLSQEDLYKAQRIAAISLVGSEFVTAALARGDLTAADMGLYEQLYPGDYARISMQLAQAAAEMETALTQEQEARLSTWFGVPLHKDMMPDYTRRTQEQYQKERQGKAQQGGRPSKGRRKWTGGPKTSDTLTDQTMTATQQASNLGGKR